MHGPWQRRRHCRQPTTYGGGFDCTHTLVVHCCMLPQTLKAVGSAYAAVHTAVQP